jgi:hypothetical protein
MVKRLKTVDPLLYDLMDHLTLWDLKWFFSDHGVKFQKYDFEILSRQDLYMLADELEVKDERSVD